MKEEITINVEKAAWNGGMGFVVNLPDTVLASYGPAVLKEVMLTIKDRIVQEWWDRHSAELLEQLAPGVLAQAISDKLKAEITKKVLGGGER